MLPACRSLASDWLERNEELVLGAIPFPLSSTQPIQNFVVPLGIGERKYSGPMIRFRSHQQVSVSSAISGAPPWRLEANISKVLLRNGGILPYASPSASLLTVMESCCWFGPGGHRDKI